MHVERIIGPPGTGKTTALMERVKRELDDGLMPERIGYYSFTRAAAKVAQKKASEAFPERAEEFCHFRTLHSEAFRQLGWSKDKVMLGKHLQDFAEAEGYEISPVNLGDKDIAEHEVEEMVLVTLGDFLLHFTQWRGNLMLDEEAAYDLFWDRNRDSLPVGWSPMAVRAFEEDYRRYKMENGLLDFNDMLLAVLAEGLAPELDVLFFDEAQDSSPLQYRVLDYWLQKGIRRHYIAGDSCQCIYQWMGSSPPHFENRPYDKLTYLTQSYRLPRRVHRLATRIIHTPDYKPRDAYGRVTAVSRTAFLDGLASGDGTVFILARNRYLLKDLCTDLCRWGLPYTNLRGTSPFQKKSALRLVTARQLARGEAVTAQALWHLIDDLPQKKYFRRGFKADIERLAKEQPDTSLRLGDIGDQCLQYFRQDLVAAMELPPQLHAYYQEIIKRYGEDVLLAKPRITAGTIHSVKGMEADSIAILSDMSYKTYLGWQRLPDEEKRVWYVGATRAKDNLFLIPAERQYAWQWPELTCPEIDLEF